MAVRQNIINKRKELKITQEEVAKVAGITRAGYAAIERGLRNPSLEVAQKICIVLKMPIEKAFPINKKDKKEKE